MLSEPNVLSVLVIRLFNDAVSTI